MANTEKDIKLIMKYFKTSREDALTAPDNILKILGIKYNKNTDTFSRPEMKLSEREMEYARKIARDFNKK